MQTSGILVKNAVDNRRRSFAFLAVFVKNFVRKITWAKKRGLFLVGWWEKSGKKRTNKLFAQPCSNSSFAFFAQTTTITTNLISKKQNDNYNKTRVE